MPTEVSPLAAIGAPPTNLRREAKFRGHISEFDGFRAAGSVIVILCHFWQKNYMPPVWHLLQLGWIAMDSFFVLSGFLITGILLDSKLQKNYYRTYYTRRSLRIFPAYYSILAVVSLIVIIFTRTTYLRTLGWFFIYLGNVRSAIAGAWPQLPVLHPLWSLQIEEQFYLLYPLLVRRLNSKTLSRALWTLVIVSPILRIAFYFWTPSNVFVQYVLLPCRMEGLALGGLIAIRYRRSAWNLNRTKLTIAMVGVLTAVVIGAVIDGYGWWGPFNRTFGYFLSSVGCALLLLCLIEFRGSRITAWLRVKPVAYLGKISYGIYLFQMPVLLGFEFLSQKFRWGIVHGSALGILLPIALTIAVASLSWYALERPLLALKSRVA